VPKILKLILYFNPSIYFAISGDRTIDKIFNFSTESGKYLLKD
jgi:hypothetical protein